MRPLRARVDLGAMSMKGYSTFTKVLGLGFAIRWFSVISRIVIGVVGFYRSAEMQSVYSTNHAD